MSRLLLISLFFCLAHLSANAASASPGCAMKMAQLPAAADAAVIAGPVDAALPAPRLVAQPFRIGGACEPHAAWRMASAHDLRDDELYLWEVTRIDDDKRLLGPFVSREVELVAFEGSEGPLVVDGAYRVHVRRLSPSGTRSVESHLDVELRFSCAPWWHLFAREHCGFSVP